MKNSLKKCNQVLEVLDNTLATVKRFKGSAKLVESIENEYRRTEIQISLINSGIKAAKINKTEVESFQVEVENLRKGFSAVKTKKLVSFIEENSTVILNKENCSSLATLKEKCGFDVEIKSAFGSLSVNYSPDLDMQKNRSKSLATCETVGTIFQELKSNYGYTKV